MSAITQTGNNNEGAVTVRVDNKLKVKLRSYEGNVFEIDLAAAKMSVLIRNILELFIDDDGEPNSDEPIPLIHNSVSDVALEKIIGWCEHHWNDQPVDENIEDKDIEDEDIEYEYNKQYEELSSWDKNFIDVESQALLFDIIVAANYMGIKGLVEVVGKHICNKIKGKSCEEVRQILKITNDFTPEEEAIIHKENEWIHAKN